jgi:hypothetical protein
MIVTSQLFESYDFFYKMPSQSTEKITTQFLTSGVGRVRACEEILRKKLNF